MKVHMQSYFLIDTTKEFLYLSFATKIVVILLALNGE